MARIERFEDLEIWKLAKDVANQVYDITSVGKFRQDYILRDQIRRAVISIFSNIAEGFERNGNKEFLQFLSIAKASCGEVRAQLIFASDREYISPSQFETIVQNLLSLSNQIGGFCKYLRQAELKGSKFNK
ncbi:MAG TPA: four helix bundle protein [Pyrinomonadaceae bacterium]|nr:four helix bundle protein [Pyrinomonadaceae bacterium]